MNELNILVEGGKSTKLKTAGKYCDRDIVVTSTGGAPTSLPKYEGEYEVTPTAEGFELKTKHRYMDDDLKIKGIPYFEARNLSGGNTVYIAGEIERS